MQTAAKAWERILFTSGGLLALHKCYWWLIAWDWSLGLPRPRQCQFDNHQVSLSNGNDDVPLPIARLEMDESNVGLGLRLSPSGNQDHEIVFRHAQVTKIAKRLNPLTLNPFEAWLFYTSIFMPKIFYPAKITALRRQDWDNILRPCTGRLISKMGFNSHTGPSFSVQDDMEVLVSSTDMPSREVKGFHTSSHIFGTRHRLENYYATQCLTFSCFRAKRKTFLKYLNRCHKRNSGKDRTCTAYTTLVKVGC